MKKMLGVMLACLFLLCGCASSSTQEDLQRLLNQNLVEAQSLPASSPVYSHGYYSYYIEPRVGKISAGATSNVFMLEGTKFIMNLNVPGIVRSTYYRSAVTTETVIQEGEIEASASGSYLDYNDASHNYKVNIWSKDDVYYTIFSTDTVQFFSASNRLMSVELAGEMLQIARTINVDKQEVANAYTNRQMIVNTRKKVELFQYIAPENGAIEELFEDGGSYSDASRDGEVHGSTPEPSESTEEDLSRASVLEDTPQPEESEEAESSKD